MKQKSTIQHVEKLLLDIAIKIAKQGKGSYKRKSLYGVCTMQISNYKLKSWIDEQLAEIVR